MKICNQCHTGFEWSGDDQALLNKVSPVVNGQRFALPSPTFCPLCAMQVRWAFRNQFSFYKRKSAKSGKELISVYSPDKPDVVYSYDEWWADDWDATDYGRDFDFSRSFFEQFAELFLEVPKINLIQDGSSENCEYTNYGIQNKNCYLTSSFRSENCYYGLTFFSKNCVDCHMVESCERCYECIDCKRCYNAYFCQDSEDCADSYFLKDCTNCKNCLGCKNIKNKEYHIFNQPVSKEEYEKQVAEYKLDTIPGLQAFAKKFDEWRIKLPSRFAYIKNAENAIGNYIEGAKNCYNVFEVVRGGEDCRHVYLMGLGTKDCLYTGYTQGELNCETDGLFDSHRVLFAHFMRYCSDMFYSMFCYNSKNCFGCTGLNRKEFCILNKPYTESEYHALLPKIIEHMVKTGEWGNYFPAQVSSYGYNETRAMEIQELSKEEALKKGFKWSDYENPISATKLIPARRLPDLIKEVPDDILNWGIECETTGKPFKVIEHELRFYREQHLPIPHLNPTQRHMNRVKKRLPWKLWDRKCQKCNAVIHTSYAPDRPEIVYCEECYLKEIY